MEEGLQPVTASKAHRLDTSRDNEILQRFVRINLDEQDTEREKEEVNTQEKSQIGQETTSAENAGMEKQKPPQSDHPKLPKIGVNIIEKEVTKKGLRKRRRSRIREEENYTDKDRAAAVNMGTRDIKQSLKLKRKQDRSKALAIPEEAEPATFLALGNYEMSRGDLHIALDFMTKALELNPNEKNALVARSKCYLLLGQPENGLRDAETALAIDKTFIKALFQKAESLYYLGDFEHSLMYYHRGLRLRPDHESFKLGVQKAQKAIENAIGGAFRKKTSTRSSSSTKMGWSTNTPKTTTNTERTKTSKAFMGETPKGFKEETPKAFMEETSKAFMEETSKSFKEETPKALLEETPNVLLEETSSSTGRKTSMIETPKTLVLETPKSSHNTTPEEKSGKARFRSRSKTRKCPAPRKSALLRELGADKDYLDNLLNNPDIRCQFKENDDEIIDCIKDAVEYLNKRQEFWRQQLPPKLKQ